MALTKLGRTGEAGLTLEEALAQDPEDALTHANMGWNALYERDRTRALEHFREALRLDPELDHARAGMVEALKARNPLYGLMLRYFLWMSTLSGKVQWAIIIGGYLGYRFLGKLATDRPDLAPYIRPVLVVYVVFALLTWIAAPLFNLLLRFNRYGRYALSRDQRRGSTLVGVLLVPALAGLIAWLITDNALALLAAGYFGFLLLPASAIFACDAGWPRTGMVLYTLALAGLGPLSLVLWGVDPELGKVGVLCFIWGSVLSGFVANLLISATVKR
jgi:hypothetical protein